VSAFILSMVAAVVEPAPFWLESDEVEDAAKAEALVARGILQALCGLYAGRLGRGLAAPSSEDVANRGPRVLVGGGHGVQEGQQG